MYEVTNNSTKHGLGTPHGISTPHRMPTIPGESLGDIMGGLSRQLYPTGRAWWMQKNGVFDNLHNAINRSFIRIVEDSEATINSVFPDSVKFDINDCELWEYRLGLVSNPSLSLDFRRQMILRKMAFPSNIKARQSRIFIESQLQLAGFNVWVHENLFPYKTPNDVIAISLDLVQHGGDTQHGLGTQHGFSNYDVIANENVINESYSIGSGNLWATFFIGGEVLGEVANIPSNRILEFKELVLKLKPAHTVAFTFINYV